MIRRRSKVDDNQKEIVTALRRVGAKVRHVHIVKNLFDILVAYRGVLYNMEIKDGNKFPKKFWRMDNDEKNLWILSKLEQGETECKNDFESVGVPYNIAYDVDSALKIIGAIQ